VLIIDGGSDPAGAAELCALVMQSVISADQGVRSCALGGDSGYRAAAHPR
jgi:hypothetical protein